ncbi:Predicted transcriptional regulator, contains an HTH and PUA-like domains [Lentzea albidocapillata]|uniref:Predicted transcriptional regulator, contains an HTH and PUA-like domains n=2 Tax=Lentzea albidocapillata TaxID=40571 RepID=A0A1W2FRY8_9PSEU|nr:Predicted transcriptional regulator, contains an HTH and PUA-like domains [Lentzea albidocapillata]
MTASSATLSRPVVISLRPRFADAILSGEKTVELRRHRMAAPLGTLLILYSSAPVMAVVGTAVLADRHTDRPTALWNRHRLHMSLTRAEFRDYLTGTDTGTALSLRDVVRLPTPFSLGHLRQEGAFQPPQSFRYLSSDDPEVLHHLFTAN